MRGCAQYIQRFPAGSLLSVSYVWGRPGSGWRFTGKIWNPLFFILNVKTLAYYCCLQNSLMFFPLLDIAFGLHQIKERVERRDVPTMCCRAKSTFASWTEISHKICFHANEWTANTEYSCLVKYKHIFFILLYKQNLMSQRLVFWSWIKVYPPLFNFKTVGSQMPVFTLQLSSYKCHQMTNVDPW